MPFGPKITQNLTSFLTDKELRALTTTEKHNTATLYRPSDSILYFNEQNRKKLWKKLNTYSKKGLEKKYNITLDTAKKNDITDPTR